MVRRSSFPGMFVDLQNLCGEPQKCEGLSIERVADETCLRESIRIVTTVFGWQAGASAFHDVFSHAGFALDAPWQHFVGRIEHQPVAVSTVYLGSKIAGVFSLATLADYRRRGVGSVLAHAALQYAKQAGYRIAILKAREMAIGIYKSLGFSECCEFEMYGRS